MSFSHMIILAVIALIVIPPEKLPEVARQLARFIRDLKRNTAGIWDDLKQDVSLKPENTSTNTSMNTQHTVATPVAVPTETPETKPHE